LESPRPAIRQPLLNTRRARRFTKIERANTARDRRRFCLSIAVSLEWRHMLLERLSSPFSKLLDQEMSDVFANAIVVSASHANPFSELALQMASSAIGP
jgi:hypothetical protein